MGKVVYVFPGQGSQHLGMGKSIYKYSSGTKAIFEKASEIIGEDIIELCVESFYFKKDEKEKKLSRTINVQPAMFVTSAALFHALEGKSRKEKKDWYAALGHSFGEYAALYAAGAFTFEDGLSLVKRRAECMAECSEGSGMAAIYSNELNPEDIKEICREAGVNLAIENSLNQIVVGGYDANLEKAMEMAKKKHYSATRLKMEGSPHTELMKPASEKFGKYLRGMKIWMAKKPVIANTSAKGIVDPEDIRKECEEQLYKPVMFRESVRYTLDNGADTYVEIGPGDVVSGIIKRIYPSARRFNVYDRKSLKNTLREM